MTVAFIIMYVCLVALLGYFGKQAQKMFIEGRERAEAINEMKEYIYMRRELHGKLS